MRVETFRTILVPASVVEECRALASHFPGGEGMFITPVYTGSELTHYISTGYISTVVADTLDNPEQFAALAGITTEQAQALRDGMDVSTESWQAALERIGGALEATEEL